MSENRLTALVISSAMPVILGGFAGVAFAKSEIKGAAILDTACGKVAVKQMGLVHDGKMDEANLLDGAAATLTVKKTTKDKNGSSTETITQNFKIDGAQCSISR